MVSIDIPRPDDWHVHLRDDDLLAAVVGYSARRYRYALVMPNLRPPIITTEAAAAYRARILDRVPRGQAGFVPLMTLFVAPTLDLADLRQGAADGIVEAVKYYPAGATTNADQAEGGLGDYDELFHVLTDLDMRLLVHAESTDPAVDLFDREQVFLERELAPVCARHPQLGVTVEHISTKAGVDFVQAHDQVVASITPHHLARHRGDLLADGMRPDLYCKPVINSGADQEALIAAATSSSPDFFLGTDSAPHPTTAKYAARVAAGVFNAPYGLEVVAEVFHAAGRLDRLAGFAAHNGAAVYGVPPAREHVRLQRAPRSDAPTDRLHTEEGREVVFFGVEEAAMWTVNPVDD